MSESNRIIILLVVMPVPELKTDTASDWAGPADDVGASLLVLVDMSDKPRCQPGPSGPVLVILSGPAGIYNKSERH
jgi:hypothetical protein